MCGSLLQYGDPERKGRGLCPLAGQRGVTYNVATSEYSVAAYNSYIEAACDIITGGMKHTHIMVMAHSHIHTSLPPHAHSTVMSGLFSGESLRTAWGGWLNIYRTWHVRARGHRVIGGRCACRGGYWAQMTTITPPNSSTREAHFVFPEPAAVHNGPDLVPSMRHRILDADMLADLQVGEGAGVRVVLTLGLVSTSGCPSVAVLGPGLPVLRKGLWRGRNTGTEGAAIQHLGGRTACRSRGVAQFQETPVKILAVDVSIGRRLQYEVLCGFDRRLCVAVRLGVMW